MTAYPRWGGVSQAPDTGNPSKYASDKKGFHAGQCSAVQNDAGTPRLDWHKFDTTGSGNVLEPTKKNAAPMTGGAAFNRTEESNSPYQNCCENNTPKRVRGAMSKWAKDRHKKVARAIGFALTLGTESAWHGITIVLMARLSDEERAALAFAALMSLSDEHAAAVAEAAT